MNLSQIPFSCRGNLLGSTRMVLWTRLVVITLLSLVLAAPATSQEIAAPQDLEANLQQIRSEVESLEASSQSATVSDASLAANKVALQKLSQSTFGLALKASASLRLIDEQITALGPAPDPSVGSEPETVAEERQRLAGLKGETALLVREAEKLAVQISNIIEAIAKLRSGKFAQEILARHPVSYGIWQEVQESLPLEIRRLNFAFSNWFRLLGRGVADETTTAILLTLIFAALVAFVIRMFAFPLMARPLMEEKQPYLRRVLAALTTTLVPSAAVSAVMIVLFLSFKHLSLLPPRVDEMVRAAAIVVSVLTFVYFLTRAVLAPGRKYWRVFEITESAARRLTFLITILSFIYAGDYLFAEMRAAMASSVAYTVLASFVSTLLFAAVLSLILLTRLERPSSKGAGRRARGWEPWFYWPMWIAIVIIVGSAFGGYVSLARFLSGQIVVTGAILVGMYIGILSARAVAAPGAMGDSRVGNYLMRRLDFSELSVDQLGLVFGGLIIFGVGVVGVPLVLLQWGFQQDDVQSWIVRALGGFDVGDVRISFANIALAIVVFVVVLVLTRMFQRWLGTKVLTRTRLDSGARHSIGAGIGYLGFIIAAIVALDYSGIDLSNLALIAGALSVGIGFGLQNVVNNFVSGVILLVERPIRVGDWIVVGDKQGYVKNISVRATELETFDRQSIVIPNAELINTAVGNWMLKDQVGRLIVEVGVSYDANEEEVRDILYRLIAEDNRIAPFPKPYVYFKNFGDSALIFEVRVFLNNVNDIIVVGGDMRFAIRRAFREAGIAIPFPQRDIHIQEMQPTLRVATSEAKEK